MAADAGLNARIEELVALFNRKSLDLPDGLFDRRTQFLLNGTPFEAMLGRSPSDPLVLMIARGPAGYRFAIKALQHAVPDARVDAESLEGGVGVAQVPQTVRLRLSGHLRGTGDVVDTQVEVELDRSEHGVVTKAAVTIDPEALVPISEARLRD